MGDEEVCVCFLVEALGINQPKISRHLAYLRRAGLVAARREGKWMHYRIAVPRDPSFAAIFKTIREWLDANQRMRSDRTRLVRLCCSAKVPEPLKRAPKPAGVLPA
jgi:ArsR family transcriptional regulator